ncbi:HIT family protein [Bacteroidia bacterium]|nr:HIT family protein [Bacteroidia bacterium]GHT03241.1 HIT family protein [Bacteroidia bacterium]GHT45529.1 HIT family protein [Bacteroidia bacterium]
MSSIFSKIIAGKIPSYKIVEDPNFIAFLDIHPVAKGHALVVPKKEVNYIFDMEDRALADMMVFAKQVAKAMQKAIRCKKIGMAVIGLDVPHAHIHLIPIKEESDMYFNNPRKEFQPTEFETIAKAIADAFE